MLLTDKPGNRNRPTYENVVEAMKWLVRGARSDDSLFLHCMCLSLDLFLGFFWKEMIDSGHGGQTKDLDGDEADGWDEGTSISL